MKQNLTKFLNFSNQMLSNHLEIQRHRRSLKGLSMGSKEWWALIRLTLMSWMADKRSLVRDQEFKLQRRSVLSHHTLWPLTAIQIVYWKQIRIKSLKIKELFALDLTNMPPSLRLRSQMTLKKNQSSWSTYKLPRIKIQLKVQSLTVKLLWNQAA